VRGDLLSERDEEARIDEVDVLQHALDGLAAALVPVLVDRMADAVLIRRLSPLHLRDR
jgi:hypothetical protein